MLTFQLGLQPRPTNGAARRVFSAPADSGALFSVMAFIARRAQISLWPSAFGMGGGKQDNPSLRRTGIATAHVLVAGKQR